MATLLDERYFHRHILFHTHVAKTAGSSIVHALTHSLGHASVMDTRRVDNPRATVARGWRQRRALKVFTGHFWHGTQEHLFLRRPVYLAAVRDPIDRFNSLFNFVLAGKGRKHPYYDEFSRRGPDESALWFFLESPRRGNEIAGTLGVPPGMNPIDWLERRYAIVAPTTRADSLIVRLQEIFAPEAEPLPFRSNSARAPGLAISPDVAEECRAAAATDLLLCRQVEDRYDEWLHDLPARLESRAGRDPVLAVRHAGRALVNASRRRRP